MKFICVVGAVLFSASVLNAQTIAELEGRYVPPAPVSKDSTNHISLEDIWEDIVDAFTPYADKSGGLGYNYSHNFPLTFSVNGTYSCLSGALELGFNLQMKDFGIKEYYPSMFAVLSPGFYGRFFSINCGVGIMGIEYMRTVSNGGETSTSSSSDSFSGESEDGSIKYDGTISSSIEINIPSSTSTYYSTKAYLILKPSIMGYIPICDEDYYITVSAGYNYFPKFKELNGWSFGVGFQWTLW